MREILLVIATIIAVKVADRIDWFTGKADQLSLHGVSYIELVTKPWPKNYNKPIQDRLIPEGTRMGAV